jgi:aminoglycoside phosphotransferase
MPRRLLPTQRITDGRVIGYVDLGELGVADRCWIWQWRHGRSPGTSGGLEGLFLAAYGASPDPRRHAFFRLLYDLAS